MPEDVRPSSIDAGGRAYLRLVVRTHWIGADEDLGEVMRKYLSPLAQPGDWAIVSEKAVLVAHDMTVPAESVIPGRLALALTRWVQPREGSRGISIPQKMQYVIERVGTWRILIACAASALTRPFGLRGAFYLVAGDLARGIDGMRPPYDDVLLPPLHPWEAKRIASRLSHDLGLPVAIVDINDFGGSVRAVSHREPSPRLLRKVLRDNPLSQRAAQTPLGLIRPP